MLLVCGLVPASAAAAPAPELDARAWVLVDASDGKVLAARRPNRSLPVASTTKLMTAYVARRELRLGETVTAPAYAAIPGESLLGLRQGERIDVRDLLYGLILASGNDAAEALAQAAAGSEQAFVSQMNRAARRLDLDRTSYANPIGLDEEGNFSSATDLAELAIVLRRDPLFRGIFDSSSATLRSGAIVRTIPNRNLLVTQVPYVNGVKTGHTIGAGYVLVGSATRRDTTLVSAVLGTSSEAARDAESLELLDYGFSLYRRETAVRAGAELANAAVRYQDRSLGLAAARDVRLTVRRGERVRTTIDAPDEVEGPVARGQRLGTVSVRVGSKRVASVPLAATRAIPAATALERVDAAVPGSRAAVWALAAALAALLIGLGGVAIAHRRASPR